VLQIADPVPPAETQPVLVRYKAHTMEPWSYTSQTCRQLQQKDVGAGYILVIRAGTAK
jgi:hypothetical protein